MAAGAVNFKIIDIYIDESGPTVDFTARACKVVEDDEGVKKVFDIWTGKLSYAKGSVPPALATIRAALIAEIKAKHLVLAAKTIT